MTNPLPYVKRKIVNYNSLLDMKEDMDGTPIDAKVAGYKDKKEVSEKDKKTRSTKIKDFIRPNHYPDISAELLKMIPLLDNTKNSENFQVFEFNYLIYNEGDFFIKHKDQIRDPNKDMKDIDWSTMRIYSTSTMISQSEDFEGGEFIFYDKSHEEGVEIKLERGETLLFDSTKSHEVKPVTKGTREVLVAWISLLKHN